MKMQSSTEGTKAVCQTQYLFGSEKCVCSIK